jgi:hypothetical protein
MAGPNLFQLAFMKGGKQNLRPVVHDVVTTEGN